MTKPRLFPLVLLLLAGFLTLPAATDLSAQNCPYIFYWGTVQSRFTFDEAKGQYNGVINSSLDEMSKAIDRAPRMWDGQALQPKCSFQLDTLSVKSDYHNPELYAACQPALLTFSKQWNDTTVVVLRDLLLPDGKTGTVSIYFSRKEELRLFSARDRQNSGRLPLNTEGRIMTNNDAILQWSTERFDANAREFFTIDEFWSIVEAEPLLFFKDNRILRPDAWAFTHRTPSGMHQYPDNSGKEKHYTLQQMRTQLRNMESEIREGTSLYFYTWDTSALNNPPRLDTISTKAPIPDLIRGGFPLVQLSDGTYVFAYEYGRIQVANIVFVPDGDPRLPLRGSQRKNFKFQWGQYTSDLLAVHDQSFEQIDGSRIHAQRGYSGSTHLYSKAQILGILSDTAMVKDGNGQTLSPLSFTLELGGKSIVVRDGVCPKEFLKRVERDLKPAEQLTIRNIIAGNSDLSFASFNLEARSEDSKSLQYPAFAPLNSPPDQQVRLTDASFDLSAAVIKLEFHLPEAGEVTLSMNNIDGSVSWTNTGQYVKGANKVEIPMVSGIAEPRIITLTAHGHTVQQQYFPPK